MKKLLSPPPPRKLKFWIRRWVQSHTWYPTLKTILKSSILSCDFFDWPYLFSLDPAPRSNRWTDLHALWLKRRVSAPEWSIWGLERWGHIFLWGNMPQPLPQQKMGENRQFQAKTPKNKNRHSSKTINRIKTKFEDQKNNNYTSWMV